MVYQWRQTHWSIRQPDNGATDCGFAHVRTIRLKGKLHSVLLCKRKMWLTKHFRKPGELLFSIFQLKVYRTSFFINGLFDRAFHVEVKNRFPQVLCTPKLKVFFEMFIIYKLKPPLCDQGNALMFQSSKVYAYTAGKISLSCHLITY